MALKESTAGHFKQASNDSEVESHSPAPHQSAAAANTARRSDCTGSARSRGGSSQYGERCLSGDHTASAACSTLLLRLLPGLDLPPGVVPTRITKLPNGVRDSASPPRISRFDREQHRDGDFWQLCSDDAVRAQLARFQHEEEDDLTGSSTTCLFCFSVASYSINTEHYARKSAAAIVQESNYCMNSEHLQRNCCSFGSMPEAGLTDSPLFLHPQHVEINTEAPCRSQRLAKYNTTTSL
ncbi:uncharacterized protein [Triticum aestivum]|uniref:uncharacterized protein n=1 Tax=Triticum aestivum TaxID=4565 RepID=UPI001D028CC1|nr:uncharacterized protein LOC123129487 [Triticum aestivum]